MSGPFFNVPDEALEADIATVAQKGGGKTYTKKRLVERLLEKGRRVCVLDPLNNWWGLQGRADGSPGFPILVIGGPNADMPLDPGQGAALAAFVAGSDDSTVIDVSELRRSDLIAFATEFLNELYRINRAALWLVLEEADVFAPQNPSADGSRAMHDAADQIARRGRQRGFRLWTITQRPARLSKDLLTQASTLILLRIRGPQDRNAAADWVKGHAETEQAKAVVDSLASLKVGEGWVYSPDFDLVERVRFPPITTLDTSRTPAAGEKARGASKLAKPDVEALRTLMTKVGAEPPAPSAVVHGVPEVEAKRREEVALQAGRLEAMNAVVSMLRLAAEAVGVILPDGFGAGGVVKDAPLPLPVGERTGETVLPPARAAEMMASPPASKKRPQKAVRPSEPLGDRQLSEGAVALIETARRAHRRVSWAEAALLAGRLPHGGYHQTVLRELRDEGWTEPPGNDLADEDALLSVEEVRERHASKLQGKGAARQVFEHIWTHGPKTKAQVAQETGRAPQGGFWQTTWKALRTSPAMINRDGAFDIAPVLRELAGRGAR